jgi:hypothetical protein
MSAPVSPSTLYDYNGSPVGTPANPLYVAGGTGGGGGGGGGPVTIADGADVALGAKADTAWDGSTSAPSLVGIFKSIRALLAGTLTIQGIANGVPQPVVTAVPTTSAVTNVSSVATATAGNLLAANVNRKRYSLFNDSTAVAYVLEGSGIASATNYSYQIQAGGYFNTTEWGGAVSAAWASANGAARVTEYTA